MMGDPVRAVRLLRGDPSSEIAPLSTDAWTLMPADPLIALTGRHRDGQARLSQALAKAASDTVCSEPPDFLPTDAAVLIQVDDSIQAVRRWCADSCQ